MRLIFRPLRAETDSFLHLDGLRFIASMSVIAFHWRGSFSFAERLEWMSAGRLMVDAFFIVSGIVISHVYSGRISTAAEYARFLHRRIARLAPLHWATLIVYAALGVAAGAFKEAAQDPGKYDWSCFIPNLAMIHSLGVCNRLTFNAPSWSISAEMALYVAFPLLARLMRVPPLFTIVGCIGIIVAMFELTGDAWTDWTYNFGVVRAVPAFLFGMTLYRLRDMLARLPAAGAFYWGTLGVAIVAAYLKMPTAGLLVLIYFMVAFALAADQKPSGRITRALAPFSQLTYSTYMLHMVIYTLGFTILGQRVWHLANSDWLLAALIPALLAVSYASFQWFETPARQWINSLSLKPIAPIQR